MLSVQPAFLLFTYQKHATIAYWTVKHIHEALGYKAPVVAFTQQDPNLQCYDKLRQVAFVKGTTFDRKGNLNGYDAIKGITNCFSQMSKTFKNIDWFFKVDSDIILKDWNWINKRLSGKKAFGFCLSQDSHDWYGCFYGLHRDIIPMINDKTIEACDRKDTVPRCYYLPQDRFIGAVVRNNVDSDLIQYIKCPTGLASLYTSTQSMPVVTYSPVNLVVEKSSPTKTRDEKISIMEQTMEQLYYSMYVKDKEKGSMSKISSIGKSLIRAGTSITKTSLGFDVASKKQFSLRLQVCKTCPSGQVVLRDDGSPYTCGKMFKAMVDSGQKACGCVLNLKARDIKEKCPNGHWDDVDSGFESPANK